MRLYSSAVMLCCASSCGVTKVGSGTTCAEEAVVITVASIVARLRRCDRRIWALRARKIRESGYGKTGTELRLVDYGLGPQSDFPAGEAASAEGALAVASKSRLCDT